MSERTPGPYEVSGPYVRLADTSKSIVVHVLKLHGDEDANVEFIVRACNSHDALLAAALGALERCVSCGHERRWHGERDCSMCAERDFLDACQTFRVDAALRIAIEAAL